MPERLWKFVSKWREKGVSLSDDEADYIYRCCLRKMEVAKVKNPEEYIDLLFPDEIKDYLFRAYVNATAWLRMNGLEVSEDVQYVQSNSVPSPVS